MDNQGRGNEINLGENVALTGKIVGDNNAIIVAGSKESSHIHLDMTGSGNIVHIASSYALKGLTIVVGSHVPANHTRVEIGVNFSIEPGSRFLLYTSGASLVIGEHCMFSSNITIRCGESPHLLFDKDTGRYLDGSRRVHLGNHVWAGENVYITKSASVAEECVIGACSVVTKGFSEPHCVLAGNPAKVVRRNIQWIRNKYYLKGDSIYAVNYDAFNSTFDVPLCSEGEHIVVSSLNAESTDNYTLDMTLENLRRSGEEAAVEVKRLREIIRHMHESTSWRVTKPLRFVKRLILAVKASKST